MDTENIPLGRQQREQLERYKLELLYHICRVANRDPLEAVFRPIAEKHHTIVRTQVDNVVEETVSVYPTVVNRRTPWEKEIDKILSELRHAGLIATKPPRRRFLNNPPADEEDGAWWFITQEGIKIVVRELETGDLGHCQSEDGLIIDWSKAATAVTKQPGAMTRPTDGEVTMKHLENLSAADVAEKLEFDRLVSIYGETVAKEIILQRETTVSEQEDLPRGFPTTENGRQKAARAYEAIMKTREEWRQNWDALDGDTPEPSIDDLRDAVASVVGKKYSAKRIGTFKRWGDDGYLDEFL